MGILLLLWPISGWLGAYFSTPRWMFRDDPFGIFLCFFCGAICGPIGAVVWFWTAEDGDIHFP